MKREYLFIYEHNTGPNGLDVFGISQIFLNFYQIGDIISK